MRMHERFKNLKEEVVTATKLLLDEGQLYEFPIEDIVDRMRSWAEVVSEAYDVPAVRVEFVHPSQIGGCSSGYVPSQNIVVVADLDPMALLHQFRHHMQHHDKAPGFRSPEQDAYGWAASLYFQAAPRFYRQNALCGFVSGVRPQDLGEPGQTQPADTQRPVCAPLSDDQAAWLDEMATDFIEDASPEVVELLEQMGSDEAP